MPTTTDESSPFELPNASEKLSYKFILDGLKEKHLAHYSQPEGLEVEAASPALEAAADAIEPTPVEAELVCGTEADPISEVPMEETIPLEPLALPDGKKYFRIGEVAELVGVEPYVLRYWESEFKLIKPTKSGSGHRVYGRKDVEALHQIRHLLHVEKFSIKGAKKKLAERRRPGGAPPVPMVNVEKNQVWLKSLEKELKDLLHAAKSVNPGGF